MQKSTKKIISYLVQYDKRKFKTGKTGYRGKYFALVEWLNSGKPGEPPIYT